jgi:hypothetical protein
MAVNDDVIYRTASVLIREHGDEADLVAAQKADSFLESGDLDDSAVWRQNGTLKHRTDKFVGE